MVAAAAIMATAVLYKSLFVRKPALEAEFVSRAEFKEFQLQVKEDLAEVQLSINASFQKLTDKIDDMRVDVLTAGERRSGEIHEKLNTVARQVAALNERTKEL